MATIGTLKTRLQKVDVGFLAGESIDQTRSDMIDAQRAQMFAGEDRDEHPIHRIGKPADYIYAEMTISQKRRKGQPTDRVTLRDKNNFHREIFVEVREETYVIDSFDEKANQLIKDYGGVIFGLNRPRRTEYVKNSLRPRLLKNVKTALVL